MKDTDRCPGCAHHPLHCICEVELRQHPRYPHIVCSSDGKVYMERKGWKRGGAGGQTYLAVDWWEGGRKGIRFIEYVHRLIAETFGQDISGVDVDHEDRDPEHNAEGNLRAMAPEDNRSRRQWK